ncbi:putative syntaxin-5 [Parelaphostrongylus tenuis]|uniref:Syntaxin-5 n=1 Tax=Parelaphostrongylus tenuis TaxID=148309 RepID=A0AAD5N2M0_PARTN|nr:putative syntaxin-5 [Parelaphostrongylus tenuis]
MSDFSVRSRRRVEDHQRNTTKSSIAASLDDHDTKKESASTSSSSLFGNYNPLGGIAAFRASPAQLWNSAQEAFSGIQSPLLNSGDQPSSGDLFEEFPVLSISGNPLDIIVFTMPSRDRTAEFKTTCKSLQMKAQPNGFIPQTKKEILNDSVQFNQLAKRIGRDLSQTCGKMEKLAELAKKKNLFDEKSDMDHLSRIVKEDITGLNKQIAALQEFARRRGGAKNQGTGHSQLVVVGLQSKLASVSKDFQSVLEISTESLKHQKIRREKFSRAEPVPMSLPSSSNGSNVRSRLLDDDNQHGVPRVNSVTLDMNAMEQMREQQQMTISDQSNAYAQARSNAMETIEGSISELGQIFAQLASLISEQGEMITRIDSNVEDVAINIDAAHTELVKYFHTISKNRWLMIKVFGILMVFFIVFVLFLT